MESDSDSAEDNFKDALNELHRSDSYEQDDSDDESIDDDYSVDESSATNLLCFRTTEATGSDPQDQRLVPEDCTDSGCSDAFLDSEFDKSGLAVYHLPQPVGGSVTSTKSNTISRGTDVEALQVLGEFLHNMTALCDSRCDTRALVRTEGEIGTVQVHLTQPTVQTIVTNGAILNMGGSVVRNTCRETAEEQPKPQAPRPVQILRSNTEKNIEKWTKGMVKTWATQVVIDKIMQGRTWITITGCPGEGKTTTGYIAMKQLHEMGRLVYDIKTPEDYFGARKSKGPVFLFNDILGSLQFDLDRRWQEVLDDALAMVEHTRAEEIHNVNSAVFILISRFHILKEASFHLGKFKDIVFSGDSVVDLTQGMDINPGERMKIWNHHARIHNVHIEETTVKHVCRMTLPHGFPHCCRLFASMYSQNKSLSMKSFFSKPLEFLNQTIKSLMIGPITGPLLREMLVYNGSLDLVKIADYEKRFQYATAIDNLDGTYLSKDSNIVTFHHPSIYDSVAFCACEIDPLFVIEKCSMSFLNERINIKGVNYGFQMKSQQTAVISEIYFKPFLQRLIAEVELGNISHSLQQNAFHDEGFTLKFMQSILSFEKRGSTKRGDSLRELIHTLDRECQETFLFLSTKSTSDKLLKSICDVIKLTDEELSDAVFGICEHVSVSSMMLLDNRYDLNLNVTKNELTPLLIAATKGSEELLKVILQKDVNISVTDKNGNTPLHAVCRHGTDGDGSVVKMLIDKGADVNLESDEYPWLPLNIACHEGHQNIAITLIDNGTVVNQAAKGEITPLHDACWMGHLDIVSLLLDRRAEINRCNNDANGGKTPLQDACYKGFKDVVTLLIDRGADTTIHSRVTKRTNLHYASVMGHADIVTFLLDRGADINETDTFDKSPLHFACMQENCVVAVTVLLDRGADINSVDSDGNTPLHTICNLNHITCLNGQKEIVTILLDKGAAINATNNDGKTPLHNACYWGYLDVVGILLNRGADISMTGSDGDTPLHVACCRRHLKLVTVLINRGADINKPGNDGDTPLLKACLSRATATIDVLLERGADVNKTDMFGHTPLYWADVLGYVDVKAVLLRRGAQMSQ